MKELNNQLVFSGFISAGDTEAIRHLKQAIADGKHWYLALLGAIGLWTSAREVYNNRTYNYLIDGEAFDWLLLAERLCETVDGQLPKDEKDAMLFYGIPPLEMTARQVRALIGDRKYGQYLNYFYGVTVEEALLLAVQEEIDKEKRVRGYRVKRDSPDEACRRIYNADRTVMLQRFRQEKGYPQLNSISLTELKEFTYWLFKYRLKQCEKARIASDTTKALGYLQQKWQQKGISRVLSTDTAPHDNF
jgi:hypothetical protein